jgi:hypothetical protein
VPPREHHFEHELTFDLGKRRRSRREQISHWLDSRFLIEINVIAALTERVVLQISSDQGE